MEIKYTNNAIISLTALVKFIEENNTKGAGLRWLKKYELHLLHTLKHYAVITLCNNITFYQLQLRCIYYNDWLIAFSVQENSITIEALLHKSRIKD